MKRTQTLSPRSGSRTPSPSSKSRRPSVTEGAAAVKLSPSALKHAVKDLQFSCSREKRDECKEKDKICNGETNRCNLMTTAQKFVSRRSILEKLKQSVTYEELPTRVLPSKPPKQSLSPSQKREKTNNAKKTSLMPTPLRPKSPKTKKPAAKKPAAKKEAKTISFKVDPIDVLPLEKVTSGSLKLKYNLPTLTKTCILKSKTPLSDIQAPTVNYFNVHKSLLVVFGTGVGKTLTAITAAECFLRDNADGNVVIITTTSLQKNFENQFESYKVSKNHQMRYKVFSYTSYLNDYKNKKNYDCSNCLLIIDEVHLLRNCNGKEFEAAMDCAMSAKKVMLLTATPFVNNICDFIPLINLLHQKYIIRPSVTPSKHKERAIYKSKTVKYLLPKCETSDNLPLKLEMIGQLLQGRVAYTSRRTGKYPHFEIEEIFIPMTKEIEEAFLKSLENKTVFEKPEVFATGYRQAVNDLMDAGNDQYLNGKLNKAVQIIKGDTSPFARNVVFTNWIQFGVDKLKKLFESNNISYEIISGSIQSKERNLIVKRFNEGKFNTLIITGAGSEGIDLKGVQKIIVLDPVWNNATLDQIKGRGVRNNSHTHLPAEFQKVDIYLLIYAEKSYINGTKQKSYSGDVILYGYISKKKDMEVHIKEMLRKISIFDS